MNEQKQLTNTSHLVKFKISSLPAPNLQETIFNFLGLDSENVFPTISFWKYQLSKSLWFTKLMDLGFQTQDPRSLDHRSPLWATRFFFLSIKGWKKLMFFGNQNPTETACVDEHFWENTDHHFLISDVPSLYNLYQVPKKKRNKRSTQQNKTKQSLLLLQ